MVFSGERVVCVLYSTTLSGVQLTPFLVKGSVLVKAPVPSLVIHVPATNISHLLRSAIVGMCLGIINFTCEYKPLGIYLASECRITRLCDCDNMVASPRWVYICISLLAVVYTF